MSKRANEFATCPGCGWRRRVNIQRDPDKYCLHCRYVYEVAAKREPKPEDALPPGRWVRNGLTVFYRPDPPTAQNRDIRRSIACACGRPMDRRAKQCRDCYTATRRGEPTPADHKWAERDAVLTSWKAATEHYKPRQVALREVA